ncbi:MAG: NAD(P)H-hydrate dehydratase [Bacteroidota bacterium]
MAIKILSVEKIREADAYTIAHEPISSTMLMERASIACFEWIYSQFPRVCKFQVFCGPGNNGGDGLVIARLLAAAGYSVKTNLLLFGNNTPDFVLNLDILRQQGQSEIHEIKSKEDIPAIDPEDILIDAILGSGLSKPLSGLAAAVVAAMNESGAIILAVDMPTGLYCDRCAEPKMGPIISASFTLSFQLPRLAFFFPENAGYIGDWEILNIGLHEDYLMQVSTKSLLIQEDDISGIIKPRHRFAHKGDFGHGLLISGSFGKCGAAILAARAALRAGAGLVTAHIPGKAYTIIQTAIAEAMVSIDESENCFSKVPDLSSYNAIAVGPGLGQIPQTANALKLLIQESKIPLILDADALNILGENKTWLPFLPKGSILTPHLKEFERITHKVTDSFERNAIQREMSIKYGVYIILKGAYSCISFPDGQCFFNPTGNPGMATGGSGDVLTGILLGLMAQGYSSSEVCLLGTYLHGLAGDIAASFTGFESLIASDIIESIPEAYRTLTND